jgi:hypothetical protein|tara:strand:+ start:162 stop:353 length:192 start_codon:yes stop_codon:yes gene_type:complete
MHVAGKGWLIIDRQKYTKIHFDFLILVLLCIEFGMKLLAEFIVPPFDQGSWHIVALTKFLGTP